jgi:pectate lyase-like protein
MKAITDGDRCGANCKSTSTKGAIVYFPHGKYLISRPIIQYYFTIFIRDPINRPEIKGSSKFRGIALIDTDFYIPGGNGEQWFVLIQSNRTG